MPEYAHDFKNVTSVGIGAFAKAHFDGAINLPKVQSLPNATDCPEKPQDADHDYGVFEDSDISYGYFPNLKNIGSRAFYNAKFIRSTEQPVAYEWNIFPSVETVGERAFEKAGSYTGDNRVLVNMPNLKTVGALGFSASKIFPGRLIDGKIWIDLPSCASMGSRGFEDQNAGVGQTKEAYGALLKEITSLPYLSFRWTGIKEIHLGKKCNFLEESCLYGCLDGLSIYLYYENGVVPIGGNGYLDGTNTPHTIPEHIYVPANLVASYKNDADWSYYESAISSIDDSNVPNKQDW